MMKLSALHQSYANRRSNSFRTSGPLDSSVDGAMKPPATLFWLFLHGLCCLISLVLGFRFSRIVFFLLFSSHNAATSGFYAASFPLLRLPPDAGILTSHPDSNKSIPDSRRASSRVVVGRHGILIRPWPHPDPAEILKAHRIIKRVQMEQRIQYGIKSPRPLIAVTPTYVRTFQTLHLTGVMHWLMNAPYDVIWIVVEANGTTNETAQILAKSRIRVIHLGFQQQMPKTWEDRHRLEARLRLHALRVVREERLDGILVFADDSNVHSLDLFDEIQKVKWIGAVSIGIVAHSGHVDASSSLSMVHKNEDELSTPHPIQGPACNSSNKLVGWHIFNSLPYKGKTAMYIDDRAIVLPQKFEWAEFVLNSRLLWNEFAEKPDWVKDLDSFDGVAKHVESPLSLLKNPSVVEPLGNCGHKVLIWWLRVEARTDSKFPPGWVIDPPLEITVPARRTPWPESPSSKKEKIGGNTEDHVEKRSITARGRIARSKRTKRRHGKQEQTRGSDRHSRDV